MRVYFAAAITSPSRNVAIAAALVDWLEAHGHIVPTRHIASPDARGLDRSLTDGELAQRDLGWIAASDALVAEVSTPSHGVGIEVAAALGHRLPVLLLHHEEAPVSRLLLGLEGVEKRTYSSAAEALRHLQTFLGNVGAQTPITSQR